MLDREDLEQSAVNDWETEEKEREVLVQDGLGRPDDADAVDESADIHMNIADVSSESESDTEMFEYVVVQHISGNPDKHSQEVTDSREERNR